MDAELVQVPLGVGLDETNEDAFVPASAMRVAQNVIFADGNVATTRPGLQQVQAGGAGSGPFLKLLARGKELLATDGQWLYSLSSKATAPVQRGRVSPCLASRQLLQSGNQANVVPTAAVAEDVATGLRVVIATDGAGVYASVFEIATGSLVSTQAIGGPSGLPHVVILGSIAYAFWWDPTVPANVSYASVNLAAISTGYNWGYRGSVPGVTTHAGAPWDACPVDGTHMLIATAVAAGTPTVKCWILSASAGVLASATNATLDTPGAGYSFEALGVGIDTGGNAGRTGIAWADASVAGSITTRRLRWAYVDNGSNVLTAVTTLETDAYNNVSGPVDGKLAYLCIGITRIATATQWVLTWTRENQSVQVAPLAATSQSVARLPALYQANITPNGSVLSTYGPLLGYQNVSKPIMLGDGTGRVYGAGLYTGALLGGDTGNALVPANQTMYLLEFPAGQSAASTAPTVAAVCAPLFAGAAYPVTMDCCLGAVGSKIVAAGYEMDEAQHTSADVIVFDFAHPSLWHSVELGDWLWTAGGVPMIYDGQYLTEAGFLNPPLTPLVSATLASAGPYVTKCGALQYIVVYAYQDSLGNVHRSTPSAPSAAIDCTTGGGTVGATAVKFSYYPCRVTYRPGTQVRVEVYRNSSATPGVWQLVATFANDPTNTGRIDVLDVVQDDASGSLGSRVELYTTGGVVPSAPPSNLSAISVHSDRVVGIAEDGRTMFFTTAYVRGECPRFTDAFTIDWPRGPVTATWSLEQRLHAATADATWFLIGDGPADTGAGVDFTTPQLWQADLGIADARGVAVFSEGAILASSRGLYLEGRDGSFTWLSKPRRTLAANPVVTGILPIDANGTVRITCKLADGVAQPGVTLHWDWRRDRWATHITPSGTGFDGAVVANGVYTALLIDSFFGAPISYVLAESATSYEDSLLGLTSFVQVKLVTGWLEPGGKQGSARVQRVQILAQQKTPHTLTVATARDYASAFDADAVTFSSAALSALASEQVRHTPTQQKCMAMSVSLTTGAPSGAAGTGQGAAFMSIALRGRVRRGEWKRLGTSQQG